MKKKVALSATAIAVLASAIPSHVAPVEAAGNVIYVSFDSGGGINEGGGNGTPEAPFNQLREAVNKASSGDTIVIIGEATFNDIDSNSAPWIIDKELTIKSNDDKPPVIDIRAGGIVLGADVKFENVVLNMPNSSNDIYANGHKLELINVATATNVTSPIDIYAGSLATDLTATSISGTKGHVIVKATSAFKAPQYGTKVTKIGAIYAGSSGGASEIEPVIEIENQDDFDSISIGGIYGTGSNGQPTNKDVTVAMTGLTYPNLYGDTGSGAVTRVHLFNLSNSPRLFHCEDIELLHVGRGGIQLNNSQLAEIPTVELDAGTTLDLSGASNDFTINNYTGPGTVLLSKGRHTTFGSIKDNSLTVAFDIGLDGGYVGDKYLSTPVGTKVEFEDTTGLGLLLESETNEEGSLDWFLKLDLPDIKDFVLDSQYENITLTPEEGTGKYTKEIPYTLVSEDDFGEYLFAMEDYPNLVVSVGGRDMVRKEDSEGTTCFYDEETDMYIYLQPADPYEYTNLGSQLMIVKFGDGDEVVTPGGGEYNINLTLGEAKLETTLVVDGVDEEEPEPSIKDIATFIPVELDTFSKVKSDIIANGGVLRIPFNFNTEEGVPVNLVDEHIIVRLDEKDWTTEHDFLPSGIVATIEKAEGEGNEHNLVLHRIDGSIKPGLHSIEILEEHEREQIAEFDFEVLPDITKVTTEEEPVVVEPGGVTIPFNVQVEGDYYTTDLSRYAPSVTCDGEEVPHSFVNKENGAYDLVVDLYEPGEYDFEITIGGQSVTRTVKVEGLEQPSLAKPIITKLDMVDVLEKRFNSSDFESHDNPVTYFTFNAEVTGESKELSKYDELTVTINGESTEKREHSDGRVYFNAPTQMIKAYIENVKEDYYNLVFLSYDGEGAVAPREDQYTIKLSYPGLKDLEFDAYVEQEEAPPAPSIPNVIQVSIPHPYGDGVTVTKEKSIDGVEIPISVLFEGGEAPDVEFKDLGGTIKFGDGGELGVYREDTKDYYFAHDNVTAEVVKESPGNYKVIYKKLDEEGKPTYFNSGSFYTVFGIDGNSYSGVSFTVTSPTEPPTEEPSQGGTKPEEPSGGNTTPTPEPKPENPSGGTTTGGGTTTEPTTPPSQGGGSVTPEPEKPKEEPSQGGTGTLTPPPTVEQPTPVPPQQEETKPTRPTSKPEAVASAVEDLAKLPKKIQEKVDSLMTEVLIQEKGTVIDLTGDGEDLSSVSTLEVTNEGVFANVDGERVKFAADLNIGDTDWANLRIIRADGKPIPHKLTDDGFTITTGNFSDILITERVVEPFVDVSEDDWFHEYVDDAYNLGITTGTTATTFSPNETITRAQAAVILARMFELQSTSETPTLSDTADKWYADEVQALVDNGIIKGFGDGTFRGEEEITRQQLALMLTRVAQSQGVDITSNTGKAEFADKDSVSDEALSAIDFLAQNGAIISGKEVNFRPKEKATRAQTVKMMMRLIPITGKY